jgi:outer membrane protein assembly factor BamE (lipoprotein component of BamABCDE complex)
MKKTILCLAALLCLNSGCLVINQSSNKTTGQRVKDSTLQQFEPGSTNKEWTLAVLGEPTSQEVLDDGTEILKYEYSRKVDRTTVVFVLFAGNEDKNEKQTAYFEFKDNLLTRYWIEND